MQISSVAFDHPDAVVLNALVQEEYVKRYGAGDITPM
jgi:hypothetical protein